MLRQNNLVPINHYLGKFDFLKWFLFQHLKHDQNDCLSSRAKFQDYSNGNL